MFCLIEIVLLCVSCNYYNVVISRDMQLSKRKMHFLQVFISLCLFGLGLGTVPMLEPFFTYLLYSTLFFLISFFLTLSRLPPYVLISQFCKVNTFVYIYLFPMSFSVFFFFFFFFTAFTSLPGSSFEGGGEGGEREGSPTVCVCSPYLPGRREGAFSRYISRLPLSNFSTLSRIRGTTVLDIMQL